MYMLKQSLKKNRPDCLYKENSLTVMAEFVHLLQYFSTVFWWLAHIQLLAPYEHHIVGLKKQASKVSDRSFVTQWHVMQGWKLFAEAHKFQAGDHILFELSSSWRLVARRVHNPGPPQKAAMARKISDVVNSCIAPDKIHRGMERSSPTSHKFLHWHQVCSNLRDWLHPRQKISLLENSRLESYRLSCVVSFCSVGAGHLTRNIAYWLRQPK